MPLGKAGIFKRLERDEVGIFATREDKSALVILVRRTPRTRRLRDKPATA